jgi:hypothetical protein
MGSIAEGKGIAPQIIWNIESKFLASVVWLVSFDLAELLFRPGPAWSLGFQSLL